MSVYPSKPPVEILKFGSAEALAERAASDLRDFLQRSAGGSQASLIALSGGRIARDFFRASAAWLGAEPRCLAGAHFFWADERCVPPQDAESNFRLAEESLFRPARVMPEQVHRIRGELPPSEAAALAAREFQDVCGREGHAPRFDLVLLGMGEDGHVASLFPGEPEAARENPALFRPVKAVKPPPHRVTVGYGVLREAGEVWVLASGAGKERALQNSLTSPDATPFGHVLHGRPATRIYTDVLLSPEAGAQPQMEADGRG